ncbi:unnamed protein product [marine sediment metagenome]|uniref:Uncharacterized protein n=1 Tax=marine sediment metagenome TaxID=412755 RepID=X1JEH4_9ZZZZ
MFVILTGGIDISVGGIAIVSFMVGADLMAASSGFPVGPIAVMLLVGTGIGVVNGTLVSHMPSGSAVGTPVAVPVRTGSNIYVSGSQVPTQLVAPPGGVLAGGVHPTAGVTGGSTGGGVTGGGVTGGVTGGAASGTHPRSKAATTAAVSNGIINFFIFASFV